MFVPVVLSIAITAIFLMVVILPVAFRMPTLGILIPPPVTAGPAVFASFREVVTGAVCLGTAIAVVLDSLVEPVVGAVNTSLAIVFISAQGGGCA